MFQAYYHPTLNSVYSLPGITSQGIQRKVVMKYTSTQNPLNRFSIVFAALLGLFLLVGVSGCGGGGGGSDDATPDQEAGGLYKDGTANLNGGALMLSDLRGFVHDNRALIFSVAGHLLFDGTVTDITEDEFTATVDVYEDGVLTQPNVAVTGMVTSQSQITGTISGTGNASGTFTLTFDMAYNDGASIARIQDQPDDWQVGQLLSIFSFANDPVDDAIAVDDIGGNTTVFSDVSDTNSTQECLLSGGLTIPDSNINIYQLTQNIPSSETVNVTKCVDLMVDDTKQYTGFAAVLSESSTDKEILIAVSDGVNSVFGLLSQP